MSRLVPKPSRLASRVSRLRRSLRASIHGKIYLPAIEFFLTDTCNLRCRHCAPGSPFMGDTNMPRLDDFVASLSLLSPFARSDEIRLLGGEPLLNRDLCSFILAARQSGIFGRILVVTNGVLLPKMSDEFWRLTDAVRVSVYPATAEALSGARLTSLLAKAARFGTDLEVTHITQFREAVSDRRQDDPRAVQRTFSTCAEAHEWSCCLLYRSRLYRCSRVHTIDRYLARIGVSHDSFTTQDGLVLDSRPALRAELSRYLKATRPLGACSFCFGTSGPQREHVQLSVEEIRSKVGRRVPMPLPGQAAEPRSD